MIIENIKGVQSQNCHQVILKQALPFLTLGTLSSTLARSSARCLGSLCLNKCLGTPLLRMPWIMEAGLPESEKISQPGKKVKEISLNLLGIRHLLGYWRVVIWQVNRKKMPSTRYPEALKVFPRTKKSSFSVKQSRGTNSKPFSVKPIPSVPRVPKWLTIGALGMSRVHCT